MRKKVLQLVLSIVLIVGGVVAYFQIVPTVSVNTDPMVALLIANPKIANISAKASLTTAAPVLTSGLPSLEQGYALSPGETGAYTGQWFGLGAKGGNVGIFVELLPDRALATQADNEQYDRTLSAASLKSLTYTVTGRFSIPGEAGSTAASYLIPHPAAKNAAGKKVTEPPTPGFTTVLQKGRAVVRVDLQGPAASKAGLIQIAQREAALLGRLAPGWKNMSVVNYPVVPSLLVVLVAALLIAAVWLVPVMNARVEASRAEREAARRRSQVASRGSKVVRRQRVRR